MKAICFEGGGAAAYCHLGVVKYLCEKDMSFDYYAGSSSGSIIATFFAAGFNFEQMKNICEDIEMPKTNFFKGIINIFKNYGWHTTNFIKDLIEKYFGDITLADFEVLYGKKLIITACYEFKEVYFTSFNEHKDLKVSEAVARSCSFPLVFSQRHGYSDGGIIANFPYCYVQNYCKDVLGIYLQKTNEYKKKISNNVFEFMINLIETLLTNQVYTNFNKEELEKIIMIETSISTFEVSKKNMEIGIGEGYNASKIYFNSL